MHWLITDRGDQDVRRLADLHYTRQTPGSPKFTRNGQNLVFITADLRAAWVTFRPTPGKAVRKDGFAAWECALFRNDGALRSSGLIREAVALTWALWGEPPSDGIITFVDPDAVASELPGYCFRRAGWRRPRCRRDGCKQPRPHGAHASDGKPLLRAPALPSTPDWRAWEWRGTRGGALRRRLTLGRQLDLWEAG